MGRWHVAGHLGCLGANHSWPLGIIFKNAQESYCIGLHFVRSLFSSLRLQFLSLSLSLSLSVSRRKGKAEQHARDGMSGPFCRKDSWFS